MKKIIIFYASYGGGHLSAAKSMKECLENNYKDIEIHLVDCIEYISKSINKITTSTYKSITKNSPRLWKFVYNNAQKGFLSFFSNSANHFLASKLYKIFEEINPDVIISTHFFATQMTSYLKSKGKVNCTLATILTDFVPHDQWLVGNEFNDLFFVAHEKMKQELIAAGIPSNKIFATGIPVSNRFLKNYNKKEIFNSFGLNPNKKLILFFGGGEFGLGKENTVKVFKCLCENTDEYQIIAISGRNKKMKERFESLISSENKSNIKLFEYTNQVPEIMSVASLVVTKPGGLTSSESLASGLPMVIINPLPGQEDGNAEYIVSSGAGVWIKKDDNIEVLMNNLLNNEETLKNMQTQSQKVGKPNAAKNICEIILKD